METGSPTTGVGTSFPAAAVVVLLGSVGPAPGRHAHPWPHLDTCLELTDTSPLAEQTNRYRDRKRKEVRLG